MLAPRRSLPLPSLRSGLALASVLLALFATISVGQAQSGAPVGSLVVWPAGWNMVSFGNDTSFSGDLSAIGTLFTLPQGAAGYTSTNLQHVTPGTGYWAFFPKRVLWVLRTTSNLGAEVTVPAGACAMVANRATDASARVTGASRVYVWSPLLNNYVPETLLGIGRAAWACNDDAAPAQVAISDQGDVLSATFPDCCRPQPFVGNGQVRLTVQNNSPYPMTAAMAQMDPQAETLQSSTVYFAIGNSCASCPEYDFDGPTRAQCEAAGVDSQTFTAPAGRYLLHLQSEGPNVPDVQTLADLQPNTSYSICFYVWNGRPQNQ